MLFFIRSVSTKAGHGSFQVCVEGCPDPIHRSLEKNRIPGQDLDQPATPEKSGCPDEKIFVRESMQSLAGRKFVPHLGGEKIKGTVMRFGKGILPRGDGRITRSKLVGFPQYQLA